MKICAAQIRPLKGAIEENIDRHQKLIEIAADVEANVIFFPELSVTSYQPSLAAKLAIDENDVRFDVFQTLSDYRKITIAAGAPVQSAAGVLIGMLIFEPDKPRRVYCKQHLHVDESPFFIPGERQVFLDLENYRIAPAICYESLLPEHAAKAFDNQAKVYLASVAKSDGGVEKAFRHYPAIAQKYGMTVMMANSLGASDDFESVGQSAVWNAQGEFVARLDDRRQGLLIYDIESGQAAIRQF